jgi:hypothetical protein
VASSQAIDKNPAKRRRARVVKEEAA